MAISPLTMMAASSMKLRLVVSNLRPSCIVRGTASIRLPSLGKAAPARYEEDMALAWPLPASLASRRSAHALRLMGGATMELCWAPSSFGASAIA